MNLRAAMAGMGERAPLPDAVTRMGVGLLVARSDRMLAARPVDPAGFAREMAARPIATDTAAANDQHYELPAAFFGLTLGPRRKYSCCLYPTGTETLEQAEIAALDETVSHAGLADGQRILELGCGWGSLTLTMADRFPAARIVAVSNSASQRRHIQQMAAERGLSNVEVITADMNGFAAPGRFDRVVSVEMFEHMSNWRQLLQNIHGWLEPDGRLFLHVFSHRDAPYRFDSEDPADWIGRYFFSGGIMPSHALIRHVGAPFAVERDWQWDGTHYRRTAEQWLARYDANIDSIRPLLRDVYGADAKLWERRWRLFYLAVAGLFGHDRGRVWGVSHYLLAPEAAAAAPTATH